MSARKFSIKEYITTSGEIRPSVNGLDISNLNQLRVVVEDAGGSNAIEVKVKLNGQSSFTTLTTITGSDTQVIDIETYDRIKLECTTLDGSRVLVVAVGFAIQKAGAFEYTDLASFPTPSGSGNFAWDTASQIMYYDEPSSATWVQITGSGASGSYFPEDVKPLSAGEITAKAITLLQAPTSASKTRLFVEGAPTQVYGVDFTVSGTTLSWSGLGLDGVLVENDNIFVTYN
jgi:hypothetical protein